MKVVKGTGYYWYSVYVGVTHLWAPSNKVIRVPVFQAVERKRKQASCHQRYFKDP